MSPKFPVFVLFFDREGDDWLLDTPDELAASLEWYDSEEDDGSMAVVDWDGKPVNLKIEACEIKRMSVEGQAVPQLQARTLQVRERARAA